MSLRCKRNRFSRTDYYPTRRQTPETECAKLSGKDQIPEVEKGFTALLGIPKLLQELCPKTLRTLCSILQDAQKRRKGPSIKKISPTFRRNQ